MIEDLKKFQAIIFNNPPYTPKFNPIEEVFGIVHNKMKFLMVNTKTSLIRNVYEILKKIELPVI